MNISIIETKCKRLIEEMLRGNFKKENDFIDYKRELNTFGGTTSGLTPEDIFLKNFLKDILSFGNSEGGIIFLGLEELSNGKIKEVGLTEDQLDILAKIDGAKIAQKFKKLVGQNGYFDLQLFNIGSNKCYYFLISKNEEVLFPIKENSDYHINQGQIFYRLGGKNQWANENPIEMNRFMQHKVREKNKDFIQMWSQLLPQMMTINPKDVMILNPGEGKIYGLNEKKNILDVADINVSNKNNTFTIILEAIHADEIGKISTDEGKPLYKIVGELQQGVIQQGGYIHLGDIVNVVQEETGLSAQGDDIKKIMHHLGWVSTEKFNVKNPKEEDVFILRSEFLWITTTNEMKKIKKVVFSQNCIPMIIENIKNKGIQKKLFGKFLPSLRKKK